LGRKKKTRAKLLFYKIACPTMSYNTIFATDKNVMLIASKLWRWLCRQIHAVAPHLVKSSYRGVPKAALLESVHRTASRI
jgi:hypothetical protein